MRRVDDQVTGAAALAAQMVLDLSAESRAELIGLRAEGWRACVEFSFDADGFGFVYLTGVAPDGERRVFGQAAYMLPTRAH